MVAAAAQGAAALDVVVVVAVLVVHRRPLALLPMRLPRSPVVPASVAASLFAPRWSCQLCFGLWCSGSSWVENWQSSVVVVAVVVAEELAFFGPCHFVTLPKASVVPRLPRVCPAVAAGALGCVAPCRCVRPSIGRCVRAVGWGLHSGSLATETIGRGDASVLHPPWT